MNGKIFIPTHTNRYLPYTSHHPKHQKLAITHSLHNRISSHITDQTERQIARREVRQTLRTNGYPYKYTYPPKPRSQRELPTFTKFTSLPYIQGTTEKIRRILNEVGVKVCNETYSGPLANIYLPLRILSPLMKLPALYMKFLAKTVTLFMLARPNET